MKPSSTITAAGLTAMGMTVFWAMYGWLALGPAAPESVVSLTTGFVSTLVGYFWPETVYAEGWKGGPA